jgi:nitroreductase
MSSIKVAKTNFPVLDIIKKRWSARAFSDQVITDDQLNTLLEAASWAASANNEQPWQFLYAKKNTEGFNKIWSCLMPGNQPWAINASVLLVSIARNTFEANQKPNPFGMHDLGMATSNMLLQASDMNIYSHPMAGFDKAKLIADLNLSENQMPICVIALGFLAPADTLEEPFKERELTPRNRKAVSEFAFKI